MKISIFSLWYSLILKIFLLMKYLTKSFRNRVWKSTLAEKKKIRVYKAFLWNCRMLETEISSWTSTISHFSAWIKDVGCNYKCWCNTPTEYWILAVTTYFSTMLPQNIIWFRWRQNSCLRVKIIQKVSQEKGSP